MCAPGVYFAIYYQVPDRAFYRAAMTWAIETQGGVCRSEAPIVMEMVATVADFRRAWESVVVQSSRVGMPVVQGAIFSHASKGSSDDGLEFRAGESEDGTLSQSEIVALPKLNWAEDGLLTLTGCNSGLVGSRDWAPADVFAKGQGVTTVGQAGYAYFSTRKYAYSRIDANSQTVYLWAYKRARNGILGGGGRMPGMTFSP